MSAARIYMKTVTGQPITNEEVDIVKNIIAVNKNVRVNNQPVNLDITTYEGARNYFQLFIYSHNKDTTADLTLKAYLAGRSSAVSALEVTPNGIDFGKGGGQEVVVGQFDFTKDATDYLTKLEEHLNNSYHNVSLDFLNSSVNVPYISNTGNITTVEYEKSLRDKVLSSEFRDVNISTDPNNPKYVNSIQAIIEFDKNFLTTVSPVTDYNQKIQEPNALDNSQAKVNAEMLYDLLKTFMQELSAGSPIGSVMGDISVVFNRLQNILKQTPDALPGDKKTKLGGVQVFINQYSNIPSKPTERSNVKFLQVEYTRQTR